MDTAALVPLVVLVPLLGAAMALAVPQRRNLQSLITFVSLTVVALIGVAMMVIIDVQDAPLVMAIGGWEAPVGIVLMADRLSAALVTTSAIVLIAVLVFSIGQRLSDGDEETPVSIFFPSYLVLGAGVFDAFVANDLFNLYVAFEILLVASYVLLTMGGTGPRIRAGITYIVVSLVSSVLFLAALGIIYGATGTVSMAQLSIRIAELNPEIQLALNLLLLVAFGIKAAIFPLSFWLPDSYPTAPAPVTAVFAGLLTKVGIYAILRSQTMLFPESDINQLLMWMAALTLIVGILGALSQRDIKRLLSFTLVSHIGYLLFGIAINTAAGFNATVYYIIHHIIVQTTMFLCVGMIERVGGSTNMERLSGLLKKAPLLAVMTFITMMNLGGIPPFSGFLGKVGLFSAAAANPTATHYWLIGIGTVVSLLTLNALIRMWTLSFWRPKSEIKDGQSMLQQLVDAPDLGPERGSREVPKLMTAATASMVVVCLGLTLFAGPLMSYADRAGRVLSDRELQIPWYVDPPQEVKP
ncbi:Na+/H+ antiporter subunit D [Canibacter zhoujuaniae]|uniref:Na+/H+ antiporter subunit D n=1 Tax=Canibacter zhoujuaniae TaxID=2708343 RepID=UPI001423EA11|nr:Na+/H+ antiporter subunit D [Canibacter zhoujuaniae]